MRSRIDIIQRSRAILILFVFGFSLLPRQVLHNFITNHKHIRYADHPGKIQLSAETFSCKADTIFLQQHFDIPAVYQAIQVAPIYFVRTTKLLSFGFPDPVQTLKLRGPPSFS